MYSPHKSGHIRTRPARVFEHDSLKGPTGFLSNHENLGAFCFSCAYGQEGVQYRRNSYPIGEETALSSVTEASPNESPRVDIESNSRESVHQEIVRLLGAYTRSELSVIRTTPSSATSTASRSVSIFRLGYLLGMLRTAVSLASWLLVQAEGIAGSRTKPRVESSTEDYRLVTALRMAFVATLGRSTMFSRL